MLVHKDRLLQRILAIGVGFLIPMLLSPAAGLDGAEAIAGGGELC